CRSRCVAGCLSSGDLSAPRERGKRPREKNPRPTPPPGGGLGPPPPPPPLLGGQNTSPAPIPATNGRIGIMSGSGNSQIWRSGNKIALAIRIPKIAPEAPIVGVSAGGSPQRSGTNFTAIVRSPAPTPHKKK